MNAIDLHAVNWHEFAAFAAVSLVLLWGIAYNGAKGQAYKMEIATRKPVPESHVRQSASCAVALLVFAAVVCGGGMLAFQAWYGAR